MIYLAFSQDKNYNLHIYASVHVLGISIAARGKVKLVHVHA